MDRKIAFVGIELSNSLDRIEPMLTEDKMLEAAIKWYSEKLYKEDNIETFRFLKNMIITETGYKAALFDGEAEKIPNPLMN